VIYLNKKTRKEVANVVAGIFLIVSLGLYFYLKINNFYILIGILFVTLLIELTLLMILPTKQSRKRNSPKNKKQFKVNNRVPPGRRLPIEKLIHMELDKINGHEFEELCRAYLSSKYKHVEKTKDQKDGGVDIVYVNEDGLRVAVQCKHYLRSGKLIDVNDIRKLDSARKNHKCMLSEFITTSRFTKPALAEASDRRMETHDILWVKSNIDSWRGMEK
jgi:restriction system protein